MKKAKALIITILISPIVIPLAFIFLGIIMTGSAMSEIYKYFAEIPTNYDTIYD